MTPRIVFHAGFHKTGTTSVQDSLVAHAPALGIQVQIRQTHAALSQAADAARNWSVTRDGSATARLQAALRDWVAGLEDAVLLVSCEDFVGHLPGHRGLSDYSAAPFLACAVADALEERFAAALDLRFLYTTRAADPWLRSVHWQLAAHPALQLSARKFAGKFGRAADFAPLLARIRAALPGVPVTGVSLEDLTARRLGPVAAVYDLAGIDTAQLTAVPPSNQRPPHDLADAFVALNRAGIAPKLLARMKQELIALSVKSASTLPSPPPQG